ncbi:N-methyl-L-tryptophan oxidase [Candidatus Poribacteria bacterium]|nr:MAG: N-methyl-L-tryptophan oxidase [Candidatus Poribacteria bacterium]
MSTRVYDAIVIGAGGMGSATAYHLAKSGADVLVLEQFQRGHKFGSSHGETRIIRFFYDKPFYTELMKTAYSEWRDLESVSGKPLLFITGSVGMGAKGNPYGRATKQSLDAAGVESELWNGTQLADRFPQFQGVKDMDVLWQKDTGFLRAAACTETHLQLAEKHGATVQEETPVIKVDWQTGVPTVQTQNDQFQGKKIVVTAGAWTGTLLAELNLPLTVTRQQVCYYQPTNIDRFQPDRFPVFVESTVDGEFIYGIPAFGSFDTGGGLKIARHGRGEIISPDTRDRTPDAGYIAHIDAYVQERIPELGKATHAEVCLYTETPDEDFIIDTHPDCPDVLIGAGFSGHGFKFCALVGRIMSELVLNSETDFDIHPFRIDRKYEISTGIPRLQG